VSSINKHYYYQIKYLIIYIPNYFDFELFPFFPAASLTVSTTLVGILLKDFVGIIYYNDKKDIVKIASLSYTGRRNDDYIPRTHLTPYKTWKVCPILSKFKDDQGKKEYKIIANNGKL
jgi:hypothetical protein